MAHAETPAKTAFARFLRNEIKTSGRTQQQWARDMNISEQYLSDLSLGRRLPSVAIADVLTEIAGNERNPMHWHLLGARAHGWRI